MSTTHALHAPIPHAPRIAPPGPAAQALRTLYLHLATLHLDAATALALTAARLAPASLTDANVAALPEFAADMHAASLLDILRNLIAYGPGPDPVAALLSTADYHARNTSSSDEMCAHHTAQEQLHRELAGLVRGALAPMAETSGEMCGAWREATDGAPWRGQCTRLAHLDGPHVEHRRDGVPVAIWAPEPSEPTPAPEGSAGR